VLAMSYRGYGYSEGTPTEKGLMLDSEAIVRYTFEKIREDINVNDVYIFGRSLGGAVGIYVTDKMKPKVIYI
jgi:alpha-beta hydrolase superfamily lysophospholipase